MHRPLKGLRRYNSFYLNNRVTVHETDIYFSYLTEHFCWESRLTGVKQVKFQNQIPKSGISQKQSLPSLTSDHPQIFYCSVESNPFRFYLLPSINGTIFCSILFWIIDWTLLSVELSKVFRRWVSPKFAMLKINTTYNASVNTIFSLSCIRIIFTKEYGRCATPNSCKQWMTYF